MDVRSKFIKMCERAKEIQTIAEATNFDSHGNYFADSKTRLPTTFLCCDCGTFEGRKENKRFIWLPRQDQLQQMVAGELYEAGIGLVEGFNLWYYAAREDLYKVVGGDISMEQLWLVFVMKEKYGKTWNGEDWNKGG